MSRTLLIALLAAAPAMACRTGESGTLSDSAFVAIMGDLRRVRDSAAGEPDSLSRAAVLRRHRVTAEQLEQTARHLARDPDRASAVWRAIDSKATRAAPAVK